MIKINIEEVLARAEQRKNEPKPLPKIVIRIKDNGTSKRTISYSSQYRAKDAPALVSEKSAILEDLEKQYAITRKERAKLSSQTAALVESLAKQFRKDAGASAEHDFMSGHIPVPALKEHYAKISAITDELTVLYDKIRSVKETGALPKEKPLVESIDNLDTTDIKAINYEIRRMDDLIYKTQKKIDQANGGIKAPKNSSRMLEWKEKIAKSTTKRDILKIELSQLRHGQRALAE